MCRKALTMTTTTDTITREIKYSRQDRDYACYVEGQYIGSRANYSDAETLCDQVAYDLIADGQCATATELDGGASVEAIAADYACSEAHPCANPNHNHSRNYCSNATAPILAPALLAEADAVLARCPGAFEPCGAAPHPRYAPFCQRCALVLDRVEAAAYIQRLAEDSGAVDPPAGPESDPVPPWPIVLVA